MSSTDTPSSIRWPRDLHARLCAEAEAHDRSFGGEVRAIVRAHLDREHADVDPFETTDRDPWEVRG